MNREDVRVTVIASIKGGGTKSSVAQLWATGIEKVVEYLLGEEAEKPVPLLIDHDGQGTASFFNGVYDPDLPTMYHVEKGEVGLSEAIIKKGSYGTSPDGVPLPLVDIVPANDSTHAITEMYEGVKYLKGIKRFREIIESECHLLPYTHYFIDTPGTQGPIHLAQALAAADDVIVPIIPDPANFSTLHQTVDTIKDVHAEANSRLRIDGFLVSRAKRTTSSDGHTNAIYQVAHDDSLGDLKTKVYYATIRDKNDIVNSQGQHYSLVERDLGSMQTHEVIAAIAEYLKIFNDESSQEYLSLVKRQMTGKEN